MAFSPLLDPNQPDETAAFLNGFRNRDQQVSGAARRIEDSDHSLDPDRFS